MLLSQRYGKIRADGTGDVQNPARYAMLGHAAEEAKDAMTPTKPARPKKSRKAETHQHKTGRQPHAARRGDPETQAAQDVPV